MSFLNFLNPISAAASIFGGLNTRSAINSATKDLTNSIDTAQGTINTGSQKALGTLSDLHTANQGLLQPYEAAGQQGLDLMTKGIAPGGTFNTPFNNASFDLYKDPSYNFRLQQGLQGLDRSAASKGLLNSGGAAKAVTRYGQGMASEEYQNAFNRFQTDTQNRYNRVRDLTGIGQNATTEGLNENSIYGGRVAQIDTGTAAQIANLQTERGPALGQGEIGRAQALNQMISGLAGSIKLGPAGGGGGGGGYTSMTQLAPYQINPSGTAGAGPYGTPYAFNNQ